MMGKGKVYLVGAGPGDVKLLTIRGLELLKQAEVLVYDRLASGQLLKEVPEDCECIFVGKSASAHTLPQNEINEVLVEKALAGKKVVRLKGGDPYVFGRGGEEAQHLYRFGIDFEVVPGISSVVGGLAYGGIPVTHRDFSSSFHVFSAHLKSEDLMLDWQTIGKLTGTLVFVMGAKRLSEIALNLLDGGMNPQTPVAIITHATTSRQKVVTMTLTDATTGLAVSPSLIVVGDVVNVQSELSFFEKRSLFGKTIVVTRARRQNGDFASRLMDLGANVVEVPTIKIQPFKNQAQLIQEIEGLNGYDWLVFTSVNGVEIFFNVLYDLNLDVRKLAHLKVAVIGKQTGKTLEKYGIRADVVPKTATLEGLAEALGGFVKSTDRILMPKAKVSRDVLAGALLGEIVEVPIYETVIDLSKKDELLDCLKGRTVDYVTFSSASTVNHFVQLLGEENLGLMADVKIFSLGPITSEAIVKHGFLVYKEASEACFDCLVEEMVCE